MSSNAISKTNFNFPGQTAVYTGKVRDVYTFEDKVVLIATDRISAFDAISSQPIPYKGQVLNQIAAYQLNATKDLVPNWVLSVPDPNVTIGKKAEVVRVEVIIRGYLAGSMWRAYQSGQREFFDTILPEGLRQNQKLTTPILTPTSKEESGHDIELTPSDIEKYTTVADWNIIVDYAHKLFDRGAELAAKQGLILVDTKYEFGKLPDGQIILIDEIHTPDSSRYFYADTYQNNFDQNLEQKQLSKEFVRNWLIEQGYQGQTPDWPTMPDDYIKEVSERYIELYETLLGQKFVKSAQDEDIISRIEKNILTELEKTNATI